MRGTGTQIWDFVAENEKICGSVLIRLTYRNRNSVRARDGKIILPNSSSISSRCWTELTSREIARRLLTISNSEGIVCGVVGLCESDKIMFVEVIQLNRIAFMRV